MDIVLINGVDYQIQNAIPQIGQLILREILKIKYKVICINFDYLVKEKEMNFKPTLNENVEQFANYVCRLQPKIVGFYTICNSFMTTLLMAKRIKEMIPEVIIVFGGPHATLTARECLSEYNFVDVISLGEGEKTILPLMDILIKHGDLSELQGIAYMKNRTMIYKEPPALLTNDELGQFTPMEYKPFMIKKESKFELEAGRGCPFQCTFCSTSTFWGRRFRMKPVEVLLQEMKKLNELYGVKTFSFVHDLFTVNREYLLSFCNQMTNENIPFHWTCSSRVDVLTTEMTEQMKNANCTAIYLGIETGSSRMQKLINKNINLQSALMIIQHISKIGIEVTVSFIFGFPDETIEDFQCTIGMIEKIFCMGERNVQLHRFMLLPHTKETEKVADRAYFDENDVDFSIYEEKLYDESAKDIIRKHPNTFIQFYTFESQVRKKYRLFDSFVYYMGSAMGIYHCCIQYLIQKYGLERIYFNFLEDIENVYLVARTMQIANSAKIDSLMPEIYQLANKMFLQEFDGQYTEEFHQYYLYETCLWKYLNSGRKKPVYYEFSFDVIAARKSRGYVLRENTIKFYYEKQKLRVSRVRLSSPTDI